MSQVRDFLPRRRRGCGLRAVAAAVLFVLIVVAGVSVARLLSPAVCGPGRSTSTPSGQPGPAVPGGTR